MATELNWESDWPAPAKINLFLHVIGRRADGYHLLQTVFRFIDVCDRLRFAPRADDKIVLSTPLAGTPAEQNLALRAAIALRGATGIRQGITITIDKRLPVGGGLGGGSSDAATTLLALNQLWNAGLSSRALQTIGLGLGADVPIFIYGHSAFAEGVGEQLTRVAIPPAWYLVLVPSVAVPTAAIFSDPALRRDTPTIQPDHWRPGFGDNDLEAVACHLYPEVARHLQWLGQHGPARMSGSGACCFAEFNDEASARAILAQLPAGMKGFVARGIDRHPLAEKPRQH